MLSSTTQKQLSQLHAAGRNATPELLDHLAVLQTLPCYAGLSNLPTSPLFNEFAPDHEPVLYLLIFEQACCPFSGKPMNSSPGHVTLNGLEAVEVQGKLAVKTGGATVQV